MLSDSDGHKKALPHKGDAGTFCCLGCNNVCSYGAKDVSTGSAYVVNVRCADQSKFHRHTNEDMDEV